MITAVNESVIDLGFDKAAVGLPSSSSELPVVTSTVQGAQKIAFVDSSLDNIDELIASLSDATVYVIGAGVDGVSYISDVLSQYATEEVDSVHVVSHGNAGALKLGATILTADALTGYSDALAHWGDSTTGDILLYGCNVAAGETGISFIEQLAKMTGGDIQASTDLTGSAALDGDWDLETSIGEVESSVALTVAGQMGYEGVLRTITSNGGGDTATVSIDEGAIVVTNIESTSETKDLTEGREES